MKQRLFLDKNSYLHLLEKQKSFVIRKENEIQDLKEFLEKERQFHQKGLRRYEDLILKLQEENNEFRAFKKGKIWALLKKWRNLKTKITSLLLKSKSKNTIVKKSSNNI